MMNCWTQRPNPAAAAAETSAARDPVRRQTSTPRHITVPASSVRTISALALRLQSTKAGGQTIKNAVASHATPREKSRSTRTNWTQTNTAKHRSVTALQGDDARTGQGERRAHGIDLRYTLVVLSPQKGWMLAVEHVASHEPFDGLVGVEEPIGV